MSLLTPFCSDPRISAKSAFIRGPFFLRRVHFRNRLEITILGPLSSNGASGNKAMLVNTVEGVLALLLVVGLTTNPKAQTKEGQSPDPDLRKLLGAPDPQLR